MFSSSRWYHCGLRLSERSNYYRRRPCCTFTEFSATFSPPTDVLSVVSLRPFAADTTRDVFPVIMHARNTENRCEGFHCSPHTRNSIAEKKREKKKYQYTALHNDAVRPAQTEINCDFAVPLDWTLIVAVICARAVCSRFGIYNYTNGSKA